jgi:sialidase-1
MNIFTYSFAENTVVFRKGESGYFCFRIPAILTTAKGTLIAFAEARMVNCDDHTQIDIAYKRSLDNGKTWSDLKVACRGNGTNGGYTAGNPAPVQLKYNQRILLPFCKNNAVPMQTYSDDDGLTFSPPEVIHNIAKPDWKWIALGPPGGLLLQSNRIIIPGDFRGGDGRSVSFVMYNDFNGQIDKWILGGNISLENYHPNECQAVELLPDANSIFVNSRTDGTVRVGAYSNDGGLTFNKVTVLKTLIQPLGGCEGSTLYHQNTRQIFYSGIDDTSVRHNLSLHISNDNGENWRFVKTIWAGPSAYSSLTTLSDQSVGVLYEGGIGDTYATLTFTIVYNETEKKYI